MFKTVNSKVKKGVINESLKVIILLLDDAAVLLLIVLLLGFLKIEIPWPVVVIAALAIGALVFIIHKVVILDLNRKPVTGIEGMVGARGRVVKRLTPIGVINVDGEHWRAESIEGNLGSDENVEIVAVEGLTLKVRGVRE
jgi:membrane-bound serine protease (ClpP class)